MAGEFRSPHHLLLFWAGWSRTAVKRRSRRGRSQRERGRGVGQCQLCPKTLWTAGPWEQREATETCRMWYAVRLILRAQLLLVWNPRKRPCSCWCQHRIMRPACIVSQTPTSCCLQSHSFYSLNDVGKRICLFSFFPIVVLFFSREKMWVSSAEIHQMWARLISPIKLQNLCHKPIGNSTGLIIWYHLSTFFFQKLSPSYFVPFK